MTRTVMMFILLSAGLSAAGWAVPLGPDSSQGPMFVSGQWIEEEDCTFYERGAADFRFDLANCELPAGEVSGQLNLSVWGNGQQVREIELDFDASQSEYRYAGFITGDLFEFHVFTQIVENYLVVNLTDIMGEAWLGSVGVGTNCPPCGEERPEPVVPEPATLALVGMGLAGMGIVRRRRGGSVDIAEPQQF